MAEGFKIADGYVEVHAKYDRSEVEAAAEEVGRESGTSHTKGFTEQLRDEKGRFTKAVEDAVDPESTGGKTGRGFGLAMLKDASSAFSGGFVNAITLGFKGGSISEAFASNPYTASAGLALGASLAIPAAAALNAGLGLALTGGVLVGGILLAARSPAVKAAGGELAKTVMGVNTDTLQATYDAALAKLAAAQKTKNKQRIADAKADVAKAKQELDDAETYNATHATLPAMAIKAFAGPLTASINAIKAGFISISPDIQTAFNTVAPALKPLTDGFVGMVKNAMPGFLQFLKAMEPLLEQLGKSLPGIGTALSQMFKALAGGAPGALKFFQDLMVFVGGTIVQIGIVIGFLSRAYEAVHNFFAKQLPEAFNATVSWLQKAWSSISKFFSQLGSEIASWPGKIGAWLAKIGADIGSFVGKVVAWFESLPGKIGAFMSKLPGMIGAIFLALFDQATLEIGIGIGLVVGFFEKLPGRISAAVSRIVSDTISFWTGVWASAKSLVSTGIAAVVQFFATLPARAGAAISSLWSAIKGHFDSAKSGAESTVQSAVNDVVNFFATLPGRARSALAGVESAVKGAFAGASSWLVSAGADILRGIASGISSATGFVVDAAKRAASNIIAGVKKGLGISSPSKVAADEIGRWIPPGITAGIESALPALHRSLADMLPGAVAVDLTGTARAIGTDAAGALGTTAGNTYVFQEGSIVLDASKIKSIQDLVDLINKIQSTARQFRARGLASTTTAGALV